MPNHAYTIAETCEISGIGKTSIYAFLKSGQLKARKLGKKTLILEADLKEFLASLPAYEPQSA